MAATGCPRSELELESDDALRGSEAAPGVAYGFCQVCGSTLFWRAEGIGDWISIAAGTLDLPTGLSTASAWWTAEASDYHHLDATVEQHEFEPGAPAAEA